MERLDRAWLDAAAFPATVSIQTRYDDLDAQGHVNNAAAVVLLQEGRVLFNRQLELRGSIGELRMMVASTRIDYAAELRHPDPVDVLSGIGRIGRSSFTIVQVIRQSDRSGVYAETVLVLADGSGPVAIPDDLRGRMAMVTVKPVVARDSPERAA